MQLTENAIEVLEARYLRRDTDTGELLEDPDGMFKRVALAIAEAEDRGSRLKWADKFEEMMSELKFLPNSPTLANAGTGPNAQLSACFVLPVPDSMDGIFQAMHDMAIIHKSGGGTGFAFSRIRPSGSVVASNHGIASGPIPFMKLFDSVSETVKQGGMRHGANMGILHWRHPDIRDFIHMKDDKKTLRNFNISVGTDKEFWTTSSTVPLYHEIIDSAWKTGDPGLVFLDRMNEGRSNPVPSLGPIEATNPCGEQPLYPHDACNLGSINLSKFAGANGILDYKGIRETVHLAVRFLDDVVTVNKYPTKETTEISARIRRIGLGVMGWADLLIALKVPYDSPEALAIGMDVMSFIQTEADAASHALAMERGSFPEFSNSMYAGGPAMRNSTRTTIAPTGTISIIAGCSSGIEPVYKFEMERRHKIDRENPDRDVVMKDLHPAWAKHLAQAKAVAGGEERFTYTTPYYFQEAHQIPWKAHLKMQAAFQKSTDNAVSKTINMPNETTAAEIGEAYREAYESGCKGITVYRDGCRDVQVLSAPVRVSETSTEGPQTTVVINTMPTRRRLPREAVSIRKKFRVGACEGYIHTGVFEDGTLGEVFVKMNRTGDTISNLVDDVMIAVSIGLQYGVPLPVLVAKYKNSEYTPNGLTDDPDIRSATSLMDYIFRWLEKKFLNLPDSAPVVTMELHINEAGRTEFEFNLDGCPDCGGKLIRAEGCEKCSDCNYNRCS